MNTAASFFFTET